LVEATQLERIAKVCSNQKRPYYLYLINPGAKTMAERQELQVRYLQHKCRIHSITMAQAIERYAAHFAALWETFKEKR